MNSKFNNKTTIVDIGARYGLHPTWKNYHDQTIFYLIEADPEEAARLNSKFKEKDNVDIINNALMEKEGDYNLQILNNPAMSQTEERLDVSPLFWGEKKYQTDVKKIIKVNAITLNQLRTRINKPFHFLKLDTEGSEFTILKNYKFFHELLGIRCEVSFNKTFSSQIENTFTSIHNLLLSNNFVLLNIDYDGKGEHYSKFTNNSERYGILQTTDGVWIKDPEHILKSNDAFDILNYLIFLFKNNSPDLGLFILDKKKKTIQLYKDTKQYHFAAYLVAIYFYKLKWIPNQNINEHKEFYESVFELEYPSMNKFNESNYYNTIGI
jgi:FkbM family methyltransferase